MDKHFYVDGACSTNGSWKGGYGVVQLEPDENNGKYKLMYKHAEYCANTTNNREELKAMIHVLEMAASDPENTYVIASDSAYVVNMCNDWIWKWQRNGWYNSKKVQVENLDLVQTLYNYLTKIFEKCQIVKVKGHNDNLGNELADALAAQNQVKFDNLSLFYKIDSISAAAK